MSTASGDPYPITLNSGFGGIVVAIEDTASATQTAFSVGDLAGGITAQFPLIKTLDSNTRLAIEKVEIWGPTAGIVSLLPRVHIVHPTVANTTSASVDSIGFYPQAVDIGTATRRPYVSFTWPSTFQEIGGIVNAAAALTQVIFSYTATSGATSFGTYTVIYIHFKVFSQVGSVIPAVLIREVYSEQDTTKRKRIIEKRERETEQQYKVAKMKSLTLPELNKE